MRPQKLTLKNFMPFRATADRVHEVDFSQLDLFSITGPMASGKSALIDAIVWCLYGRTARYGADSKGVISAGEGTCEVALDFTVGERWFRAVRRTGKITESGLSEREGGEWIQDRSGSALLTKRIEELLGLDFDSFTKTVILPQGQYAEFLTSEPKKRRDLLAKILELGVYARVADQARLVAGQARTRAETLRETLSQYAGLSRELITVQQQELAALSQRVEQVVQQERLLQSIVQQVEQVATLRNRVTDLQAEAQSREQDQAQAQQQADAAAAQVSTLVQDLAQLTQEREALGYDATRHEVVKRAVAHLTEWTAAGQEADQKLAERTRLQEEVGTLIGQVVEQERRTEQARTQGQTHTAALEQEIAAAGDVAALTEKLGMAKRWKELQHEQQWLTAQCATVCAKQEAIQRSLADFKQRETAKERAARELAEKLEQVRTEEQQKRELVAEAELLGRELHDAARAEKRAQTEVETARSALQQANQTAQRARAGLSQAEEHEQHARTALEDAQRRHEAAHLRETLHVGEPCPVCQVSVSAIPAPQEASEETRDLADFADISTSRSQLKRTADAVGRARQEAQDANAAVAAARVRLETAEPELQERERIRQAVQDRFVSRFSGFSSLSTALDALQIQQKELTNTLHDIEAQTRVVEKERAGLVRQRETAQQEEAKLSEALRSALQSLDTGKQQLEALSQDLSAFLSAGDDPEQSVTQRRARVVQAEQIVKESEQALRQVESTLNSLNTTKVQKEGQLALLTSQHEAALARAEREARAVRESLNLTGQAAIPGRAGLEQERDALSQKQAQHTHLIQQEEQLQVKRTATERQAAECQAECQARTRALAETQEKLGQVRKTLEEERHKLQETIRQHSLTDAGGDGENVKTQLEVVRGKVIALQEQRARLEAEYAQAERRCTEKEQEEEKLRAAETEERLASELRKLLGSEFTDFLSRGAIEALMHDASVHLHSLTHGRYTFDIAYRGRAINLQIVDHEDQRRARPTHSLSGGETFLASLAIALALSQGFRTVATGRAAETSTECLILDEGFGTLDREGLQMVTETLQELRGEEGRMIGIITHVEEVAAAMPMRIEVSKGSRTSEIRVSG